MKQQYSVHNSSHKNNPPPTPPRRGVNNSVKIPSSSHIISLLFLLFLTFSSCDRDFEDINQNPFFPTQTDIGPLFNQVVSSLRLGWNEQFYLHNETLYALTEQAALTAASFQNITIGAEDMWQNYYLALAHIREIEQRLATLEAEVEPAALNNVKAQLKIILAYKTFRLTDLFGDIPFFDAGKGFQDIEQVRPTFDSQESIYKHLLEELAWASQHINVFPDPTTEAGTSYVSFFEFDTFLKGDMRRWQKFANSLRLRHALRMVEKDPAFAEPIIQDILNNNLPLIEEGEEIVMHPQQQSWVRASSHWSFREHNQLRMGSTIWSVLSANDSTDGSGIYDPRAYWFFETNNASEWVAYPQVINESTPPSGGTPYGGQRDVNHKVKGNSNIYSPINYYLIRDDQTVPEIILTAAEMHFAKAEIYLRGLGVAPNEGEAENEYLLGVVASIQFWQSIRQNSSIWTVAPPDLSTGEIFAVTNHPEVIIFGAENKLELIYTQKWLDAFRQPWEAYSLLRRTGDTPRQGLPLNVFRINYPPSEVDNNPVEYAAQVGRMGGDSPETKVWWMP